MHANYFHSIITAVPSLYQHHLNCVCGILNVLSYFTNCKRFSGLTYHLNFLATFEDEVQRTLK